MGWVYDNREVHIRPNLQQEQVFLEDHFYAKEGLGQMVNLPLLVRGGCLGTLNIGSIASGQPDAVTLEFFAKLPFKSVSLSRMFKPMSNWPG